jgi:hypothetical protein
VRSFSFKSLLKRDFVICSVKTDFFGGSLPGHAAIVIGISRLEAACIVSFATKWR